MNTLKTLTLLISALSLFSGCASFQNAPADDPAYAVETAKAKTRKKTLLTIGGIILVGAIVAHEAQDGANDALREAVRP